MFVRVCVPVAHLDRAGGRLSSHDLLCAQYNIGDLGSTSSGTSETDDMVWQCVALFGHGAWVLTRGVCLLGCSHEGFDWLCAPTAVDSTVWRLTSIDG